jgi:hypothetical protein
MLAAALLLTTAVNSLAATHYVDVNGTNATAPYTNWSTAATTIQDAVDAAAAGDEVLITNGWYSTGWGPEQAYRVEVSKPLNLRSANGPQLTVVDGAAGFGCVLLTSGATLSGFTLINGLVYDGSGAGVCCFSGTAVVSNCVVTGNRVLGENDDDTGRDMGGGASGVTLNNCILTNNSVSANLFGIFGATNVIFATGGGAAHCTLNNCTLSSNSASVTNVSYLNGAAWATGGGASFCTLNNCILSGNSAVASSRYSHSGPSEVRGGATLGCSMSNCTVTGNTIVLDPYDPRNPNVSGSAGGADAYGCTLNNCIVYFNSSRSFYGSLSDDNYNGGTLSYCCTTPQPASGFANITSPPLFVDTNGWANLRLQSNSPCINAGDNTFAPASLDLDGNPRIVGGTVDIGAYEYQSLSLINFSVVSNQPGFSITGQSNQVVAVEASTDLTNWSPLATNTLDGHPFPFSDPTPATLPQRFYRAQAQ